jgi:tetratricopeptide (TPR) repeat protein
LLGGEGEAGSKISIPQLQEMVGKYPKDPLVRLRLGDLFEQQKDWPKAAEAYEAAVAINPKLDSAALKLAQLYSGPVVNREKALAYAKTARALLPNDPKATAVLGHVAFESGDFSWAYNLLQESSRQLASEPGVLHDLAWAAYALGKVDEARDVMDRCLKSSPPPTTADDAKEFLLLTAAPGNPAAPAVATVEIDAKIKADPRYVPALMASAALDLRSGSQAAAMERYQKVLERFPDFAPAQRALALLYADDPAHAAAAVELATKAKKSFPGDPKLSRIIEQRDSPKKKDYTGAALDLLQKSAGKKP